MIFNKSGLLGWIDNHKPASSEAEPTSLKVPNHSRSSVTRIGNIHQRDSNKLEQSLERPVIKSKRISNFLIGGFACGAAAISAMAWAATAVTDANGADPLPVLLQGIAHDAYFDVCLNGSDGFSVGVIGSIAESTDAGLTWKKLDPVTTSSLLGVTCDGPNPIAVGQEGAVLIRKGDVWQRVPAVTQQRLMSVSANKSGLAVAVGGFGTVVVSKDGGDTWTPVSIEWEPILNDFVEPHMYDVKVAESGVITIVGEFELVLRSEDAGDTWSVVHKGDASLFSLHLRDANTGFAVGQEGKILKTTDGGQTWATVASPTKINLLDVWSSASGEVVVPGMRVLLKSTDHGNTFAPVEGGDVDINWYSGVSGSGRNVVIVGHSGRIVRVK